MKQNQIQLNSRGIEKNKAFLKALYETKNLNDASRWFDKRDASVSFRRKKDSDMNLETFLNSFEESLHVVLQMGSPFPDIIRFCANILHAPVSRYAWVECPFNEHNYAVISGLFKDVYGQELDSVPMPGE